MRLRQTDFLAVLIQMQLIKKPQANFYLYAEAHNLPYLTHTNMRLRQTDFLAVLIQMQELQELSE